MSNRGRRRDKFIQPASAITVVRQADRFVDSNLKSMNLSASTPPVLEIEHVSIETLTRILLEVMTPGKPPARPDTPAEAIARQRLTEQVAEIVRKGGVVDIPSDI